MRVKLRMSSVRYVHTNRFQSEVVAFAQHFNQLQEVLGTMRAAAAGHEVRVMKRMRMRGRGRGRGRGEGGGEGEGEEEGRG